MNTKWKREYCSRKLFWPWIGISIWSLPWKGGGVVKRFFDSCIDANLNVNQFKECQRRLWKKNEVLRILIGCAVWNKLNCDYETWKAEFPSLSSSILLKKEEKSIAKTIEDLEGNYTSHYKDELYTLLVMISSREYVFSMQQRNNHARTCSGNHISCRHCMKIFAPPIHIVTVCIERRINIL